MFNRGRNNRTGPNPSDGPYNYRERVYEEHRKRQEEMNQERAAHARLTAMLEEMYVSFNSRRNKIVKNPIGNEHKAQMLMHVLSARNGRFMDLLDRNTTMRTTHPTIVSLPEQLMCNEQEEGPVAQLLQCLTGFFVEPCRPHGLGASSKFYVRTDLPRLFHGTQGRNMANPFAQSKPDGWVTREKAQR